MANSPRFANLQARLAQLRTTFLPGEGAFDPTGTYEQAVYDQATAYRLLAHAEFESFSEDIIEETVKLALKVWVESKKVSLPLLCIIASYEGAERINAFTDNQLKKRPLTINTMIHKCHTHFKHNVDGNNGIRTKNLLALLVQVGIEEVDLDVTWIGSVDAFGNHRNIIGHKSNAVAYQADPKAALDAANIIVSGFKDIDEKLCVLREDIKSTFWDEFYRV